MLSFFVTAGVLVGFDASGHVAEETKNASITAARGVFYSALASGLIGFPILILFLFCTPDLDTLYSFDSPQPFVNLYALALGQNGHCVMTTVAILGLLLNTSVAIIAASRLIFAIARDGVLPLSWWIARVSPDGQPRNAVKVIWIVAAALLCTILPSPVAFTSLVSAAGVPTITAYALIACTFPSDDRDTNDSRSFLPYSWKIDSCKMEFRPMVATYDFCHVDLEFIRCRGPV
jgi:amino acid transporter